MINFIVNNIATIIVGVIVLGIISLAIRQMIKEKKSGKSCSSCATCPGCAQKYGDISSQI